eukprot:CAMPEP_0174762096 /NCGR_PEP_ID=MMETSP1094-20130205/109606_1 /TAXON_ID=156173 /ORGANISM="Chrysochromulina brevifilum, Strain UTEX LB 985" /LENGTH=149 /DNA_ID=CAMNT_0015968047 /DNA_START=751 /DNA_END=1200 /DNA_ORIENTATION=+
MFPCVAFALLLASVVLLKQTIGRAMGPSSTPACITAAFPVAALGTLALALVVHRVRNPPSWEVDADCSSPAATAASAATRPNDRKSKGARWRSSGPHWRNGLGIGEGGQTPRARRRVPAEVTLSDEALSSADPLGAASCSSSAPSGGVV